jgi:predicted transcriptional regulator
MSSIRASPELKARLREIAPKVATRGYILRSEADIIQALVEEFSRATA